MFVNAAVCDEDYKPVQSPIVVVFAPTTPQEHVEDTVEEEREREGEREGGDGEGEGEREETGGTMGELTAPS